MSKKLQGGLLPLGSLIILFVLGVVIALITGSVNNDGWAALGIIIIFIFLTAIVMVVMLITGFALYYKRKSEFGLGLLIGTGVLVGVAVLGIVIIRVVDMIGY